ncbi:unnamed protein product [Adineta steineri]|uniref:NAD(P)(+)--arginine ADP-ribosyltransferase n=1 Tax=Adineta steineri TaxID=433720 RepID=A0A815QBA0_9BILA|nr:unnamed protein product [Adineta steineri]CAF1633221.1 unnamed protein product [Adineta steineri]
MDKGKSTANAFTVPEDADGRQRINLQHMQNVLLIWLDNNIDTNNDDCQNAITQLQWTVNDINIFIDVDQCLKFIETIIDKKVCMIIPGYFGQHIVPRVHNMSQVDSIFVLCGSKERHEQWVKNWPKIKGVFTDIKPICEALKLTAHQCEQNAIPMSFVGSNKNLDQLDPSFMYTQILKELILIIKFDQKHIQDYLDYCRNIFTGNEKEMININSLKDEYHKNTPIYWYTCDMFLYRMLNRALRLMDGDIIIRMGFFIGDLHRDIEQLHQKQHTGPTAADSSPVYRGQVLSTEDFGKMMENKGGLISFNCFLSTSKDRNTSMRFIQQTTINQDQIRVLFIMEINPAQSTTPFASIAGISEFEEEEVLFSMHSVFRIQDIKSTDENNLLYEVNLVLTADNDPELSRLTNSIRKESDPDHEEWYRLGSVLIKMGQFGKAQDIYNDLLNETKDDKDKADIYHQFGSIEYGRKNYQEALTFYKKSLDIREKILPPNHPDLAKSYNNIGVVHNTMGNYPEALSYYKKVFEIDQQSLSPDHPDLAKSYNNIGLVHANMRDYPKALSCYEKALGIKQQSLPHTHPSLASSCSNIGIVHANMRDYPKALLYHEKALEIQKQSLPHNHPSLAHSYNNIGVVYKIMGNYPEALSYYEKTLEIQQQLLPPNHSDLAMSYINVGLVYKNMENYSKALYYYEKDLEIQQQLLPSYHPDLASSYNNTGLVHEKMGNYEKARTYFEHAIQIGQQSLPTNQSTLQQRRKNLERVKNK